jgi:replication-associated recombination protein RarA
MLCETLRPVALDQIIGLDDPKRALKEYLTQQPFHKSVYLTGSPGLGKTTLALAAARAYGFEVL